MIKFQKIFKSFMNGEHPVLQGINLTIPKGESLVVLGRSGVGKSVLLKILLGILKPDSGTVIADGISPSNKVSLAAYRRKFSILFQGGALFDSMDILTNVYFGLIERGMKKKQAKEIAKQKLLSVELEERVFNLLPASLSGGMQKRAALARAIALEPEIILFDEPTAGLDPITGVKITHLLRKTVKNLGLTSITITHDLSAARVLADRIVLLNEGKLIWEGKSEELEQSTNEIVHFFVQASKGISL